MLGDRLCGRVLLGGFFGRVRLAILARVALFAFVFGLFLRLGSLFVRLGAVVGLVETTSLEQHRGPDADQPLEREFAALRTLALDLVFHGLKKLKLMVALLAAVVVCRHGS